MGAICINQEDKAKKSQQLLWMGSIYPRAREVVAWVGEEDVVSAMLMDRVPPFSDSYSRGRSAPNQGMEGMAKAFINFLERPFWRRVWVIQELALAKGTMIHCGGRQMRWSQLVAILDSLEGEMISSDYSENMTPSFSDDPTIINLRNLIKFQRDASKITPVRFLVALKRSSSALSTDPRDKVFALLGLVYGGALYVPVPNYRQSAEDICVGITLSAVDTTSNLDIIPLLGCGCDNTDLLPSWCPFWLNLFSTDRSQALQYLISGYNDFHPRTHGASAQGSKLWHNAAGNSAVRTLMQNNVLATRGFLFDQVDFLLLLESLMSENSDDVWLQRVSDFPSLTTHGYLNTDGLLQALCGTITRHSPDSRAFSIVQFLSILKPNAQTLYSMSEKEKGAPAYVFLLALAK